MALAGVASQVDLVSRASRHRRQKTSKAVVALVGLTAFVLPAARSTKYWWQLGALGAPCVWQFGAKAAMARMCWIGPYAKSATQKRRKRGSSAVMESVGIASMPCAAVTKQSTKAAV